jgi:hypothetical protein
VLPVISVLPPAVHSGRRRDMPVQAVSVAAR